MQTKLFLKSGKHRQRDVVWIGFDFDAEIGKLLQRDFPARWSQTKKCWWMNRKEFDYKKFKEAFFQLLFFVPTTPIRFSTT